MQTIKLTKCLLATLLGLAAISCLFVDEALAGGKGKGEDIILYNGNIVMRGGGKGKGKGGGSIVVANSPSVEVMPYYFPWMGYGMGHGMGHGKEHGGFRK